MVLLSLMLERSERVNERSVSIDFGGKNQDFDLNFLAPKMSAVYRPN